MAALTASPAAPTWRRGVGFSLVLGALALGALGVAANPGAAKPTAPPAPPAPPVRVATPLVQELTLWDEYTGRLAARESVAVRARVGGCLDSIHFVDGQVVAQGELLFVIDPRPFQARLDAADAEVRRLESRLALARNDHERAARLARSDAISGEELDARTQAVDAATAELAGARARREQERLELEFTRVVAPMAGRVGRHLVSPGNLVSGGSNDATLLTTIEALAPVQAYFDVDERAFLRYAGQATEHGQLAGVRERQVPVQVGLADGEDFPFHAALDFVDNRLDERTGTLRGRALVSERDPRLLPGVFVRLRLPAGPPRRVVLVPDEAVGADQTERFVWVLDDQDQVSPRRVQLGRRVAGLRVIEAGLSGAERVVVRGVQRVRPGAKVTPQPVLIAPVSSGSAE
ncbi:MAG: efflux RND transporter periplasmic adaptor subunit [Planctomycetota bacterium]